MIDPNEIQADDLVIIQDVHQNVLSGPMVESVANGVKVKALKSFGFTIPFATEWPYHGYAVVPGIKIIEHQGGMVPNADIYIRSRAQLQRNKNLRTNPT
jgi:hypothetical protein